MVSVYDRPGYEPLPLLLSRNICDRLITTNRTRRLPEKSVAAEETVVSVVNSAGR